MNNELDDQTYNPLKLKSCCGYFKVHEAVMIFGIVACVGLAADIAGGFYTVAVVRLAVVCAYFIMKFNDTRFTRMCFFYTFVFNMVVAPSLYLLGTDGVTDMFNLSRAAKRRCENYKEAELQQYGYDSVEQCEEDEYNQIWWIIVLVVVPIFMLVQFYFCVVVFTHWRNWKLPRSQGGCI